MLNKEDFMYKLEKDDWKFFAEYDTFDEYKEIHKMAQEDYKDFILTKEKQQVIKKAVENTKQKVKEGEYNITFIDLEILFMDDAREFRDVSISSFKAYKNAFNKLIEYFDTKNVDDITLREYKNFRKQLQRTLTKKNTPMSNSAINDIMTYVNMFLNFAKDDGKINKNVLGSLPKLKEEDAEKENFTDKQILEVINSDLYDGEKYNFMFKMMAYHGMRYDDLYNIEQKWIKDGRIDFDYGKTINSKRLVPIHPIMAEEIKKYNFPLWDKKTKTKDAAYKELKRRIEKIHKPNSGYGLHTFRATFMEKAINEYPELLPFIQKVVGHALSKENKLTIEKYAKNIKLKHYEKIVNCVHYE